MGVDDLSTTLRIIVLLSFVFLMESVARCNALSAVAWFAPVDQNRSEIY